MLPSLTGVYKYLLFLNEFKDLFTLSWQIESNSIVYSSFDSYSLFSFFSIAEMELLRVRGERVNVFWTGDIFLNKCFKHSSLFLFFWGGCSINFLYSLISFGLAFSCDLISFYYYERLKFINMWSLLSCFNSIYF